MPPLGNANAAMEEGLIPPEVAMWSTCDEAWDNLKEETHKVFFNDVKIAKDGGLNEINNADKGLWSNSRYMGAFMLGFFFFYNIYFVTSSDVATLVRNFNSTASAYDDDFLISDAIIDKLFNGGSGAFTPLARIATVELVLLAVFVLHLFYHIVLATVKKEHKKWKAISDMCWYDLPYLASFSAMKMLGYIVPQRLSHDITYALSYKKDTPAWMNVSWILISRPICFIIGMDCFLMKYRQATVYILSDYWSLHALIGSVVFLNQVVGVVNIDYALKKRLYRYVFAGEDGVMSPEETNRMWVWESFVTMTICTRFPLHHAVATMLSWSDDDFQKLTLNEKKKKRITR